MTHLKPKDIAGWKGRFVDVRKYDEFAGVRIAGPVCVPLGRLLSVGIMVVGVGLFLQLVRAIFSPAKVKHKCPECGLIKHDQDAIYCKHCGHDLKIETEGVT